MMRSGLIGVAGLVAGVVTGCAGNGELAAEDRLDGEVRVEAVGDFAGAFAAAKDVLREHRFELERVDARAGVITTKPRAAGGWATPWVDHASDWDGAWRDTVQDEARVVRVQFEDEAAVGVVVERIRVTRFGRRVDPTSPRRVRPVAVDPFADGVEVEVVARDGQLEDRLREAIVARVGGDR